MIIKEKNDYECNDDGDVHDDDYKALNKELSLRRQWLKNIFSFSKKIRDNS